MDARYSDGRWHHRHEDGLIVPVADDDGIGTTAPVDGAISANIDSMPLDNVATPSSGLSLLFEGVSYGDAVYGSYAADNSLPAIAAINANAVAVGAEFGIDAVSSTVYSDAVSGGYTESDPDVAIAIGEAQDVGLSVMVKPTINFLPANSGLASLNAVNGAYSPQVPRTDYNPTNVASFFASYQSMIVQEATLAQAGGASIFCIGTELDQLTGPAYLSYWTSIISAVRAVYDGKLTYAANWDDAISPWQGSGSGLPAGTGNLATQVSFWSQLDYVGIDEYAPISDAPNPTLGQLIAGWTQVPTDPQTLSVTGQQSLGSYYEGVAAAIGKPLLFTEIGYGNSSDAAINPGDPGFSQTGQSDGASSDPTLQANLYQAFFDAAQQYGDGSLVGAFLWDWQPAYNSGDAYNLQNQPASAVAASAFAACYAAGARIATPDGARAVETLHAGDTILTHDGQTRQVTWVGHRRVRFTETAGGSNPYPVRIHAEAFASGQPCRDLVLSPDHAVFVDNVLIPVRRLVNGATIRREPISAVTYWHVELDTHDILLAEGLPAESYLDTGNRASFANAPVTSLRTVFDRDPAAIWAQRSRAPLVEAGFELTVVQARLAARAVALGFVLPITLDVALVSRGSICVAVPAAAQIVRLHSPASRPAGDGRRLGALIMGMSLNGVTVKLDSPLLADGFHEIETFGAARMRWTDGTALLAIGPASRERILRIEVAMLTAAEPTEFAAA